MLGLFTTLFAEFFDNQFALHINLVAGCNVVLRFTNAADQSYDFAISFCHNDR